jgi:glycosyltransferase involved in cell wall biosynthesis
VAAALRCCSIGGIFSAEEGACYACTEYLLCGLPVVTTPSLGGRHVWLNANNSITVDASPEAVAQGVQQAMQKLEAGEFDSARIRREAVELAERFRAEFVGKILQICKAKGGAAAAAVEVPRVAEQLLEHLGSRHKLGLV